MSILQLRLKNCIQTILELEPRMREFGEDSFDKEFSVLKIYLEQVDHMTLAEDEVIRLENATDMVLSELENANCWQKPCAGLLH